jgi:two-component system, LuxR family, response regulator FixJ
LDCNQFTVCIVDDDDAVRDSLCVLLDSHGMTTRSYASPDLFLEEAGNKVDCLIFDLHMPRMTGLELAETLRARSIATPIIIVTGRNDPILAARMQRAGIAAVLTKPIGEEELVASINNAKSLN